MSAYSDWKTGCISDAEYRQACNEEARRERYYIERDMIKTACEEACRQCEMYEEDFGCTIGEDCMSCCALH